MDNKNFKIPVFLSVFVALVMVLGACAPALTPGTAPREIPFGPAIADEAPVLTPEVGISAESAAISEAVTLEDFLGRVDSIVIPNTDDEFFGLAAPVEGQLEEHMFTEFPSPIIVSLDDEILGLAAPVEVQIEEHMVTGFTTGTVSLEDEFLAAYGLATVEELIVDSVELEVAPVDGLLEDSATFDANILEDEFGQYFGPEFAPVEGVTEDIIVTEVTILDEQLDSYVIDEFAPIEELLTPSIDEGVMSLDASDDTMMDAYNY